MPKIFLRRSHPNFFTNYHGLIVAMMGVGLASALADSSAPTPIILQSFYEWFSINLWGWVYIVLSIILMVGLFNRTAARAGLSISLLLLLIRLGFQMQQAVIIWYNGATFKELLPSIAGLPILYGYVKSTQSMVAEPFTNPLTSRDITIVPMMDDKEGIEE